VKWTPEREWPDADVYLIGGGPSLREFDWRRLEGRRTIGCNSAFIHGPNVCHLCLFSDQPWFARYEEELFAYFKQGGCVATQCEYVPPNLSWVLCLPRTMKGLTTDGSLYYGYGGSTGASAIHLALLLGARRVFLLGYDGKLSKEGDSNWHQRLVEKPNPTVYLKFNEAWYQIARTHRQIFPGTEIYNTNRDSAITQFPFMDLDEALRNSPCYQEDAVPQMSPA
jgi:hypothetical protein